MGRILRQALHLAPTKLTSASATQRTSGPGRWMPRPVLSGSAAVNKAGFSRSPCERGDSGMTFLIRRNDGEWVQPSTTTYPNEAALQELLESSPELLQTGSPIAVVREFSIPGIGFVDLVGITAAGEVVVVECKLKANPQIRREVVGQALAYAGGIWQMGPDAFIEQFELKAERPLQDALKDLGADDETDSIAAVRDSVESGALRVVIAVDEITPELRTIVEYLNGHTTDMELIALELDYYQDDDVEILVPATYGAEIADAKRTKKAKQRWKIEDLEAVFDNPEVAHERALVSKLLAHGKAHGAGAFRGGTGKHPAFSCYYAIEGKPTSCWAIYTSPKPQIALSIESVRNASQAKGESMFAQLVGQPGFAVLDDFAVDDLPRYPNVPLAGLDLTGLDRLVAAIDSIRDKTEPS